MKRLFPTVVLLAFSVVLLLSLRLCMLAPVQEENTLSQTLQLAMPYDLYRQVSKSDRLPLLEQELQCTIELISYQADRENDALFAVCSQPDFKGIILFDDPLAIVPLFQQDLVMDITDLYKGLPISNEKEQFSARYQGIQYGIVLDAQLPVRSRPLIARRTDILSQYGCDAFPQTVEACRSLFARLQMDGFIPLATYGIPNSVGFAPLLAQFALSSTGSGELFWQDERIAYDKLSSGAAEYLSFVRALYKEGMIPSDFLTMDVMSGMNLFCSGKTPLLPLASTAEAALLQELCDRHAVPVEFELVGTTDMPDGYLRNMAALSARADNMETAAAFYTLLLQEEAVLELFTLQSSPSQRALEERLQLRDSSLPYDPVARQPVNIRLMKIKDNLERDVIEPYYAKIATGDLPEQAFQQMKGIWSADGGENLLEMLTRYVRNAVSEN